MLNKFFKPCLIVVLFSFSYLRANAQIPGLFASDSENVAGITALMTAVVNDDIEGVKFYSKGNARSINKKNIGGATALHIAARNNNSGVVKILLENGAKVNVIDNEGWTPIMRAASVGGDDIMNVLAKNDAKIDNFNSAGDSALIYSASADCVKCLKVIFDNYDLSRIFKKAQMQSQFETIYQIALNHDNKEIQTLMASIKDQYFSTNKVAKFQLSEVKKKPEEVESKAKVEFNKNEPYEYAMPSHTGQRHNLNVSNKVIEKELSIATKNNKNYSFAKTKEEEKVVQNVENEKKYNFIASIASDSKKNDIIKEVDVRKEKENKKIYNFVSKKLNSKAVENEAKVEEKIVEIVQEEVKEVEEKQGVNKKFSFARVKEEEKPKEVAKEETKVIETKVEESKKFVFKKIPNQNKPKEETKEEVVLKEIIEEQKEEKTQEDKKFVFKTVPNQEKPKKIIKEEVQLIENKSEEKVQKNKEFVFKKIPNQEKPKEEEKVVKVGEVKEEKEEKKTYKLSKGKIPPIVEISKIDKEKSVQEKKEEVSNFVEEEYKAIKESRQNKRFSFIREIEEPKAPEVQNENVSSKEVKYNFKKESKSQNYKDNFNEDKESPKVVEPVEIEKKKFIFQNSQTDVDLLDSSLDLSNS